MSRLMLKQDFPPTKVQPQPSATRDDGATSSRLHRSPVEYDKFDAEAGSILIALANQEPQPLKVEGFKVKDFFCICVCVCVCVVFGKTHLHIKKDDSFLPSSLYYIPFTIYKFIYKEMILILI